MAKKRRKLSSPITKEDLVQYGSPEFDQTIAWYNPGNTFADGGEFPPITVSDPNDPRLKAYKDSLDSYSFNKSALDKLYKTGKTPKGRKVDLTKKEYLSRSAAIKKDYEKYKKLGIDDISLKDIEDEYDSVDKSYNGKINRSIGVYKFPILGGSDYTLKQYKKPVQPYIYKKAEQAPVVQPTPQTVPVITGNVPTQPMMPAEPVMPVGKTTDKKQYMTYTYGNRNPKGGTYAKKVEAKAEGGQLTPAQRKTLLEADAYVKSGGTPDSLLAKFPTIGDKIFETMGYVKHVPIIEGRSYTRPVLSLPVDFDKPAAPTVPAKPVMTAMTPRGFSNPTAAPQPTMVNLPPAPDVVSEIYDVYTDKAGQPYPALQNVKTGDVTHITPQRFQREAGQSVGDFMNFQKQRPNVLKTGIPPAMAGGGQMDFYNSQLAREEALTKAGIGLAGLGLNALAPGAGTALTTAASMFAHGGGMTHIPKSAGTHEENAYGGVPIEGHNASVEGNEVIDNNKDFVFSDRIKDMKTGKTFASLAKSLKDKAKLRPDDKLTKEYIEHEKQLLALKQEQQKAMMGMENDLYEAAYGGSIEENKAGYSKFRKSALAANMQESMNTGSKIPNIRQQIIDHYNTMNVPDNVKYSDKNLDNLYNSLDYFDSRYKAKQTGGRLSSTEKNKKWYEELRKSAYDNNSLTSTVTGSNIPVIRQSIIDNYMYIDAPDDVKFSDENMTRLTRDLNYFDSKYQPKAYGGPIHIDPSKKGTFTFARNASKWHATGGKFSDWWYNNMRSQKYRDENYSASENAAINKGLADEGLLGKTNPYFDENKNFVATNTINNTEDNTEAANQTASPTYDQALLNSLKFSPNDFADPEYGDNPFGVVPEDRSMASIGYKSKLEGSNPFNPPANTGTEGGQPPAAGKKANNMDHVMAALQGIGPLAKGIGAIASARMNPTPVYRTPDVALVDPRYQAAAAKANINQQAAGADQAIRGTATSQGTYLASMLNRAAGTQGEAGRVMADIYGNAGLANTQLLNQREATRAQMANLSMDAREQGFDNVLSRGVESVGQAGNFLGSAYAGKRAQDAQNKYNETYLGLLKTGEYKMNPDGTIEYIGNKKAAYGGRFGKKKK